jgi:hypothetical protein
MRASLPLLLVLVKSFSINAQDISGKWTGVYATTNDKDQPSKIVLELRVYQDSLITGTSHFYYANGDNEHYALSGQYFSRDSSIYVREDSLVKFGYNLNAYCRGSYVMRLSVGDGFMRFEGRRKPLGGAFGMEDCPTLDVWMEKGIRRKVAPPKLPKPKDKILDRKEQVQKLIEIGIDEKDSIKVELVDNAQIDNDIVSVYLNGDDILQKHKLTAQPAVFWISLSRESNLANIRMAAESMGSIPPCTALMTVTTKKNRYIVTLSSDMGNTGTLKMILKE